MIYTGMVYLYKAENTQRQCPKYWDECKGEEEEEKYR
jgi:hypothetical protein